MDETATRETLVRTMRFSLRVLAYRARNERGGTGEVAVKGNRKGLRALAAIGSGLAELTTAVR